MEIVNNCGTYASAQNEEMQEVLFYNAIKLVPKN